MQRQLAAIVRLTFVDPRKMVDMLRVYAPSTNVQFQMAIVVASLGVIVNWMSTQISPPEVVTIFDGLNTNPILYAIIQLMALMISGILIFVIGRIFGGIASFEQSLFVVIWLSFVSVLVMVPIVVVLVVSSALAGLMSLGFSIYFMWLFVVFIQHIHGFASAWKTAAGIALTFLAIIFAFAFIMVLVGPSFEGL